MKHRFFPLFVVLMSIVFNSRIVPAETTSSSGAVGIEGRFAGKMEQAWHVTWTTGLGS